MTEQKLPNNCLLKKTKELIELKLLKETLKNSDKCFLIVDKRGAIFLNNFLTLTEVLNNGIFSIDSIYKKRKQYKSYNAIYLISGKKEIIEKVMKEDFANNKKRLYKFCHLFIIDEITNELYDLMAENNFLKHIKSLKQVSIKYVTVDKNLFSFGNDINYNSMYSLFEENKNINKMNLSSLVNVCQALNANPNILYFNADKNCKLLAESVSKELKKYFGKKRKEGILLITSRFMDFLAPLQFSTIYQNLLLETFKDKEVKYCNKINYDEKTCFILDYKDELYNKYKYRYYYEVMNLVNEDLTEFKKSEVGKALKDIDKEMVSAAKNFLKYKSKSQILAQHINLCTKLKDIENNRHILDLIDAQETIISKINEKGKSISEDDIISIIKDNKNKFNKDDLKRLLCLIKYNYPKINIDNIYTILNMTFAQNDKKIINFINKGKNPINEGKLNDLNKAIISYREKNSYNTKEENDNRLDKRYVYIRECKLTTICDMCCKNKLPDNLFSFVEKPQNLKIQNKNIGSVFGNSINENDEENKPYLILFNLGGLSNYEISSLERGTFLGQYNMNLVLGGNKVYNYDEYFDEIKDYIEGKNSFIKTEEKNDFAKKGDFQKNDIKVDINDISFDEKGSKEKIKKKGMIDNSFEDEEDEEDLK